MAKNVKIKNLFDRMINTIGKRVCAKFQTNLIIFHRLDTKRVIFFAHFLPYEIIKDLDFEKKLPSRHCI